MNCLLLLIILFCCNGNGGCNTGSCSIRNYSAEDSRKEHTCAKNNMSPPPPPCRVGTQFPYLDMEPRTCGCEEKSDN